MSEVRTEAHRAALKRLKAWQWILIIVSAEGKQGVIDGNRYCQLHREKKWRPAGYRVIAVYVRHDKVKAYTAWNHEFLGYTGRAIPEAVPVVRCATRAEIAHGLAK